VEPRRVQARLLHRDAPVRRSAATIFSIAVRAESASTGPPQASTMRAPTASASISSA